MEAKRGQSAANRGAPGVPALSGRKSHFQYAKRNFDALLKVTGQWGY